MTLVKVSQEEDVSPVFFRVDNGLTPLLRKIEGAVNKLYGKEREILIADARSALELQGAKGAPTAKQAMRVIETEAI